MPLAKCCNSYFKLLAGGRSEFCNKAAAAATTTTATATATAATATAAFTTW